MYSGYEFREICELYCRVIRVFANLSSSRSLAINLRVQSAAMVIYPVLADGGLLFIEHPENYTCFIISYVTA